VQARHAKARFYPDRDGPTTDSRYPPGPLPRLDDLLSRNLGISKTAVARLCDEERVRALDGTVLHDRKLNLAAGEDGQTRVLVDDAPVALFESAVVLQHKPIGVVTALRDNHYPTAYALLEDAPLFPELRPAGRLDLESSGLLLWTTDGALIQRLTHPKRRVPRTYQAALTTPFQPLPADLTLEDGHRPEIVALATLPRAQAHPGLVIPPVTKTLATITIVGGAYHEVRRIFVALGSHVLGLCRVSFGDHHLPVDLAPGSWRRAPTS
jgi:16S rRNA pseudouridine516 synthase